jgi:8-oxo-dGTP pyrophosphatase MutT (NUDIX family)
MRRRLLKLAYALYGLRWRLFHPVTIGVRMLLIADGQVVLLRHSYQDAWYFPGGGVKSGETLMAAAIREAHEEAGAVLLEEPWLLGVYTSFDQGKSDHIALFVCERFRLEEASDQWEIEECGLFFLNALPTNTSKKIHRRLDDYHSGRRGLVGGW